MVADDAGVAGGVLVRQNRDGCTVFPDFICRTARVYDPRLSSPQRLLQHGGLLLPATAGAILFRL